MITTRLNLILHETIDNKKEISVLIERFITIGTILLGPYLLSALRISGVSAFQGLLTYVIYVDTFGTARNVRIKVDVCISGLSARRGSTVCTRYSETCSFRVEIAPRIRDGRATSSPYRIYMYLSLVCRTSSLVRCGTLVTGTRD